MRSRISSHKILNNYKGENSDFSVEKSANTLTSAVIVHSDIVYPEKHNLNLKEHPRIEKFSRVLSGLGSLLPLLLTEKFLLGSLVPLVNPPPKVGL